MSSQKREFMILSIPVALVVAALLTTSALADKDEPKADIVETLRANGNFKILLTALGDTKLTAMFQEPGPFTFFAPTDEAFQKVPKLADLLHDTARLAAVLKNHAIKGRAISSADLTRESTLTMLSGENVIVKDGKKINDAEIKFADMAATNGTIHGIDRVLMKDNVSIIEQAGSAIEEGLKTGARKIKNAFSGGEKESAEKPATSDEQTASKPETGGTGQ